MRLFLIFFIYTFQCISSRNKVLSLENLSQSKASQEKFNRLNVIYQFFSPTKRSFNIQTVDNSCGSMFCCPGNQQQKYFYKLTETLLSMSNAQQSQVLFNPILTKLSISFKYFRSDKTSTLGTEITISGSGIQFQN